MKRSTQTIGRLHVRDPSARRACPTTQAARLFKLGAALLLFVGQAFAGMKEGYEAYTRGDYETAMKEFRPLAEQGDPAAQIAVGWLLDSGKGVAHDDAEAVRWYTLAAKQGCAIAQQYLGTMYAEGSGVARDFATAEKWFRAAADQGDAGGLYGLGVIYRDGAGVKPDLVAAYTWFTLASKQGDMNTQAQEAAAAKSKLRPLLSDKQIGEAEMAARIWKPLPSPNAQRCVYELHPKTEDPPHSVESAANADVGLLKGTSSKSVDEKL